MARPRQFDEETAVAQITEVFWAKGYQATSMGDLVDATGLNRSSLYNAFGSKRDLFVAALNHYGQGPARRVIEPLLTLRGMEALDGLLTQLGRFASSPEACRGCLMVNTALEAVDEDEARARVASHFAALHRGIERAWTEARQDGAVNDELLPREVASWLVTFVRGVLVSAGSGESAAAIRRSISMTRRQLALG